MAGMAAELHVVPHATTGGWTIRTGAGPVWFATLDEAQRAALSRVGSSDTPVFLHDRYHRVRPLVTRPRQA
jgi:hypothetical protein